MIVELFLSAVILFLLSVLSRSNPFDRTLSKFEYKIHHSQTYYRCYGWTNCTEIAFTKHQNLRSMRTAVFDAMYNYPETDCMKFVGGPRYDFPVGVFDHFSFACLDFSETPCGHGMPHHLSTISMATPCNVLILPEGKDVIYFFSRCDNLQILVLPHKSVVKAYADPSDWKPDFKIRVHSGFEIRVPQELIPAYEADPNWSSLRFVDEHNFVFPASFSPYV